MNNLGKLLALQAGAKKKESGGEVSASHAAVRTEDSSAGAVAVGDESPESPELSRQSETPSEAAGRPDDAPSAPSTKPGLKLLGAGRIVGNLGGGAANRSVQASPAKPPAAAVAESDATDGPIFGLADLAGFDASDVPEVRGSGASEGSGFDDEIEATAPERALDPDITAQQISFVESLDNIYQVLNDPELFGQSVRIIMMELQENPEYIKLVSDQDVHVMIRAMRNTMGLARIRKQEKSRKAGTGTRKAAQKKASVSDDDMALLNNLLGGIPDE